MDREAKRRLAVVYLALVDAVLVGNQAPAVAAMWRRMKHAETGDLVIEISTIRWLVGRDPELLDDRWDGQLVPFLRDERIWVPPVDDEDDDTGYWDDVLVCQNPDGTEFRWTNAELWAVPTTMDFAGSLEA